MTGLTQNGEFSDRDVNPGSPFRGLAYYAEADAKWFFGRESERKTIIGNLRAARLTLLYAESGVGKSSLLRAGVSARLREIAHRNAEGGSAKFIPVVFSSWQDEPVEELIGEIEREANSFLAADHAISLATERLPTAIKAAGDAVDATFLIILDQFEEYFGYRLARSSPERLASDLAESIADPRVRANFLIAIREDAYARLGDFFAGEKVNVYGNYLHLEYLDRAAAREAIERPIERFNATHSADQRIELEPALTEAVLDEVRRGRLVLGQRVQDGADGEGPSAAPSDEIETPFLQLVMTRLWELECGRGSQTLRKPTLDALGGAETIVRTHLDAALGGLADKELEAATDIFHDLVTPSGAKIAHTAADLEKMTARPRDLVAAVLEKLDAARVVRPVEPAPGAREERYEIFHDRLAAPLLDWVALRDNERLRREARAERRRANAFRALAIGSALLLVLAVLAVVFAEIQNATANKRRKTAQSIQLAASSQATLDTDTELSALLALQGLRISETNQAVQGLRNALLELRELDTLRIGAPVDSAAFSPDGTKLVAATQGGPPRWEGTARVWSASAHKLLGVLAEPPGNYAIESAAFSPDGKEIVTASQDAIARIWSASTYRLLGALTEPPLGPAGGNNALTNAAFSPDSEKIVTASSDGTARIWSAGTHKLLGVLTEPPANGYSAEVTSAAFNPDGKKIVTASSDGTARIWSASSYRQLGVLTEPSSRSAFSPQGSVRSAAFSPDGKNIVTASDDGTALVWSASSYRLLGVLAEPPGSDNPINGAAFSPDGAEIVTASQDGSARIWSASNYQQLWILAGHSESVSSAAFSPDGLTVITASNDGNVKLWSAAPAEQLGVITAPSISDSSSSAAFSRDGKKIVTVNDDRTARIWSASTLKQLGVITVPSTYTQPAPGGPLASSPTSAALSPDATKIVTADSAGTARIWSARDHRQLGVITERSLNNYLAMVAFSPDGTKIVTADSAGAARIWSASSYRQIEVLAEPSSEDNSLDGAAFSPDGTKIVTASQDGTARIWSVGTHKLLGVLTEPRYARLWSAAFSPDGTKIVTTSDDGTARIWSATSYRQLTSNTEPGYAAITSAAFSPDGKEIMTVSEDGAVRIWSSELAGPVEAIERIAEKRLIRHLTAAERKTYLGGI